MRPSKRQVKAIQNEVEEMYRALFENPENLWRLKTDQEIKRLKVIVDTAGWPTISLVGRITAAQFWSLAIESIVLGSEFHATCLKLMKADPESAWHEFYVAAFEDRIEGRKGRPQLSNQ